MEEGRLLADGGVCGGIVEVVVDEDCLCDGCDGCLHLTVARGELAEGDQGTSAGEFIERDSAKEVGD